MNEMEAEVAATTPLPRDEKDALRESIERSETELREAVEDLTAAVKHEVTLGARIIDHPAAWIAGGFAIGLLLAWRR